MGSTPAAAAPPSPLTTHAAAAHHRALPSPWPQVGQCEAAFPDPRWPQPCPLRSGSMVHSFLPLLVRPDRRPPPALSTPSLPTRRPDPVQHVPWRRNPTPRPRPWQDHRPWRPLSDPPRQVRHGPRPPWTAAKSSGASLPMPCETRTRTSSSIIASSSGC